MRNLFQVVIILVMGLLLIACGQSVTATPSPIPSPTITITATATSIPSQTTTATIEATPRPEYVPPTLIPTIDPTLVPGLLRNAFSIQPLEGVNGHTIRQIIGWEYGFGGGYWEGSCSGYYWLDASHLLLYPATGQVRAFDQWGGTGVVPQPAVINIESGHIWLPPANESASPLTCNRVFWSPKLGLLITSEVHNDISTVSTYTYDGNKQASYRGGLWDVSPSGTKIRVAEDTILDLSTNKKFQLVWPKNDRELRFPRLYWNDDETRIYRCCYYFGDISAGKSYSFEISELQGPGARLSDSATHGYGQWVRNGDYFLIEWSVVDDGYPNFFPMFDPAARKYYEVKEMAGISPDLTCPETDASPDGKYLWIMCYETNYLVNLFNFETRAYSGYSQVDINWSSDSKFAWLENYNLDADYVEVLSVDNKELKPLPVKQFAESRIEWHPFNNTVVYPAKDKNALIFLDAATMLFRELLFKNQEASYKISNLAWSPNGDKIAFATENSNLWLVDYPQLENLEQILSTVDRISNIEWSPDGKSITFISGSDIYIVDTVK